MNSKNFLPVVAIALVALLVFSPIVSALFENDVVVQPGSGSGTPGLPGAPGLNASCNGNLTVNSTTTLLPGTSAYVVSAWNGTWASMDFGIPLGATGADGAKGDTGSTGLTGAKGATGGYTILYNFSTSTGTPPSDKTVRYNSGTPASVTAIYIEETERGGSDVSTFLATLTAGTKIMLFKESDVTMFHLYNITGVTDSGDYYTLTVGTFAGNPSNFANTDGIGVGFAPRGAQGVQGEPGASGGDSSQFYLLNTTRSLTGQEIYRNTTNSNLNLFGGTNAAGAGGIVSVQGSDLSSDSIVFYVPDMTKAANLIAAKFVGAVAIPYLDMNARQIKSVADPTDAQDAATMAHVTSVNNSQTLNGSYADVAYNTTMNLNTSLNYASKVGGKVPIAQLGTGVADGTKYLRDDQTWTTPPTGGGDTSQFLFLNGTRAMTGNFSAGSQYIINMILPSVGTDGANKLYVDNVNATNALNTSYAIAAANTTMNANTSIAILAVNNSQTLNTSYNYASKVGGYVPTAQLGSGVADNTKYLRGDQTWQVPAGGTTVGYSLQFFALTSSPGDNAVVYIGAMPKVPGAAGAQKVWVPKAGSIKAAYIMSFSGTAGTAETWGMDVMVNGTPKFAFANKTLAAAERTWSNTSMNTPVSVGNYIEIISTQPNWGTNPLTTLYSGVVYIE